jgi:chaperonin GroES
LFEPLEIRKSPNQIFVAGRSNEVRHPVPDWSSGSDEGSFNNLFVQEENMKFRPLHDRVVVRRIESDEKTKGGIIIPDTAKEKPQEGEVVAVGPGTTNEQGQVVALDVKSGDRVLFGKWSGTEIKVDGEDLLIMKESDILGVIELQAEVRRAA